MDYVRIKKDKPNTHGPAFFREGVIYSRRIKSKDFKSKEPDSYEYAVYCQGTGACFPESWILDYPDFFEEVTREEIDKMKEGLPEDRLVEVTYTGKAQTGVWMLEPYRYFIYD